MHRSIRLIAATAAIAAAASVSAWPAASAAGRTITTTLSGANEVPGPGDPDGSGTASVTFHRGKSPEICYTLTVTGIATATAAHIHSGPAGVAGPVVLALQAPASGTSSGCIPVVTSTLKAIAGDLTNYYVNVHNAEYPAGALRGQLR